MATVTCGGVDVLSGQITLGLRGNWAAKLSLDAATVPSGQVTLASAGGLSLSGVVTPIAGVFNDTAFAWIIGGAGGLGKDVKGSFQSAQLRDPLSAILDAAGEKQSSTIASSLLGVSLPFWTLGQHRASRALDELAAEASAQLEQAITWRVLPDGSIWIGAETWPAAELPGSADVLEAAPSDQRFVLGVDTLALLPGVDLAGVGKITAVHHFIQSDRLRTWAWT